MKKGLIKLFLLIVFAVSASLLIFYNAGRAKKVEVVGDYLIAQNELEDIISKAINIKRFYKSNIDYGLITYNFSTRKPLVITKKDKDTKEVLKGISVLKGLDKSLIYEVLNDAKRHSRLKILYTAGKPKWLSLFTDSHFYVYKG